MDKSPREVEESPFLQGEDESIPHTFDWALHDAIVAGGTISAASVVIKNAALADKSSTNLSGSASIVGNTIITPLVTALVAGQSYRLECKATIGSGVYEAFRMIDCEE
jgi:hypothetical protein